MPTLAYFRVCVCVCVCGGVTNLGENTERSEARKSANTFANKSEEYASLIYNFAPLYTPRIDRYYEQVYFWK